MRHACCRQLGPEPLEAGRQPAPQRRALLGVQQLVQRRRRRSILRILHPCRAQDSDTAALCYHSAPRCSSCSRVPA